MTLCKKELRQGLLPLCIWTGATALMLLVCVLLFPEMREEMDEVSQIFANMGGFSAAFGMDRVSFGELMGFYGVECGNILGIGGGFFAAYVGITLLSKEEKDRTAEFLLTHPISRNYVVAQKLLAGLIQVILLNVIVFAVSGLSILLIGEQASWNLLGLLHLAYLLMQIEVFCLTFAVSAFLSRGSVGIGLGIAAVFYFLNIIRNLTEQADFLRYLTPYAYAEAADIISEEQLSLELILLGILVSIVAVVISFLRYGRKDVRC